MPTMLCELGGNYVITFQNTNQTIVAYDMWCGATDMYAVALHHAAIFASSTKRWFNIQRNVNESNDTNKTIMDKCSVGTSTHQGIEPP